MPGTPKFNPFHSVKVMSKGQKLTDCDHNLISSEGGQDTSACKISGHSLHAFSGKYLEIYPDERTGGRKGRKTVTAGQIDQRTHVQVKRGYFGFRIDGQMDGQPENTMPQVPKGWGINSQWYDDIFFLQDHNYQLYKIIRNSKLFWSYPYET